MGRVLLIALLSTAAGTSVVAMGQDTPRGRTEAAAPRSGASETSGEGDDAGGAVSGEEVAEGGGSKVKVYEFSGLDISGRLKSPQLLYFLNRLRAEFDRPRLPHRSFVPELVRSTKGKAF
jgi:hypothetical protein